MLTYTQLAQTRLSTTSAVNIYQCGTGEEVQAFIKVSNTGSNPASIRVFHDHNGSTYDESTAIVWDMPIEAGGLLELDHIFINNPSGSIAVRSDTANILTVTLYGVVKS